jgi:parvulin-like peptidyl-prolyl isomerase
MVNRRIIVIVAAVTLAAVGTLAAEVIEQVLVRVNGEIITKTEFEQRQVSTLRQRPEFANTTQPTAELKKAIAEITPDLILNAVDELLLVQRGKEMGFTLSDQQFASIVDNIKKENKLQNEEDFQAALKQEGMTMADFHKTMERNMLVSRVQQQEVADKVSVSEAEAQEYYAAHKQEFTTPAEITLREIVINLPTSNGPTSVADEEATRAKAENIRHRVLGGEPFAKLAAELSDAASKADGGLIGPFKMTDVTPALQKVINPLKIGEMSQVLRIGKGYQILELETRSAEAVKSFDAARPDIAEKVGQGKLRAETTKYVDKLREQAIITWRNDELKKAYEQALAKRKAAGQKSQSLRLPGPAPHA